MKVLADTPAGFTAEDRPRLVAGLLLATLACLAAVVLLFALRGERAEAAMAAFLLLCHVRPTPKAMPPVTIPPSRRKTTAPRLFKRPPSEKARTMPPCHSLPSARLPVHLPTPGLR